MVDGTYGVDQIKALEGLDAVRKRPGMYIGTTSQAGIDQTIYEVVDNSVDEYLAGHGQVINVTVAKDATVTVVDRGRGIPVGDHHEWKNADGSAMNTLTGILTKLHAGGKFDGSGYKCFPLDTMISTPSGQLPLADVTPTSSVINGYGEVDEVRDKFVYDHAGDLQRVTVEDGRSVRAVAGHYVLALHDEQLAWVDVSTLTTADHLVELEPGDDVEQLKRDVPGYNVVKYRGDEQ